MRAARASWVVALLLVVGLAMGKALAQTPALAQNPAIDGPCDDGGQAFREGVGTGTRQQPSNLGLANFFEGWDQEFTRRQRDTGTPDFALLRVQTNFLEREFRFNYFHQQHIHSTTKESLSDYDALIAWGFNRRFMIEIIGADQSVQERTTPTLSGGNPGLLARVQLIDMEASSYAFNFKVTAPNNGLGQMQTTISYGLAGFEDLAYWLGLRKTGFYYSFLFDSFAGPHALGATQNDVQYDVTVCKTLLDRDVPLLGSFSVFLETFALTNLDGNTARQTLVSLTPGVRFNLGACEDVRLRDNWILLGVDVPVSGPRPWDSLFRFSYITNF
jgi:hypothetical protein